MKQKRIIIIVGHEQACNFLRYLNKTKTYKVVMCVGRQDDTGSDGNFPSLMKLAMVLDIPTINPVNINDKNVISSAKDLNPDIVISLQNNRILGNDWINLVKNKLGIVNVHYAPLPKYGGYWPEMWAIWNKEKKFAVSMHYVNKGLDTGPVIAQKWFRINKNETRLSLYKKSDKACFKLLKENLEKVMTKKLSLTAQNFKERTYYPKSLPNDGFLDLNWDAETQERFIRAIAFPGFPGPKIKIGKATYTLLYKDIEFFKARNLVKG